MSAPLNLEEVSKNAQQQLDAGEFKAAKKLLEELVEAGVQNGHTFYNLGVANWQLGLSGEAVGALLAARELLPRDPDVKANLQYALQQTQARSPADLQVSPWQKAVFWVHWLSLKEHLYASSLLTGVFFAWLAFLLWRLQVRELWTVNLCLAIALLLMWIGFFTKLSNSYAWAAANSNDVTAYSGPSTSGHIPVFVVHEGAPMQVIEHHKQWRLVRLVDGKQGWVFAEDIVSYVR